MRSSLTRIALAAFAVICVVSCSGPVQQDPVGPQPKLNSDELLIVLLAFKEQGYLLQFRETVDNPILPALTDMYTYQNDELRFYGFDSVEAADSAAVTISGDGQTVEGTPVPWTDGTRLHYFQLQKLIILHRGDRGDLDSILSDVTGGQFAGD